jgi:hypothetical protein
MNGHRMTIEILEGEVVAGPKAQKTQVQFSQLLIMIKQQDAYHRQGKVGVVAIITRCGASVASKSALSGSPRCTSWVTTFKGSVSAVTGSAAFMRLQPPKPGK